MEKTNTPGSQIEIETQTRICWSMERAGVPIVHRVAVRAIRAAAEPRILTLQIRPAFGPQREFTIPPLAENEIYPIEAPDLRLDAQKLQNVIEREGAVIEAILKNEAGECARASVNVEILAFNEWNRAVLPELLATFVTPNHPAVAQILTIARDLLQKQTGNPALDGYQSKSRARVREICDAIYRSIQKLDITYVNPPASFESQGQKLRFADQILQNRMGTCIDLTVLIASAFEQCGLHPICIIEKSHAYPGVWLSDETLAATATDDEAAIRKLYDAREILVFDSSTVTHRPPETLAAAEAAAAQFLTKPEMFRFAVDVTASRRAGFLPLPVGGDITTTNPTTSSRSGRPASADEQSYNDSTVSGIVTNKKRGRVDVWKERLLELSLRNRLIHFKPSRAKSITFDIDDLEAFENELCHREQLTIEPKITVLHDDPRSHELSGARGAGDLARDERLRLLKLGRAAAAHEKEDLDHRFVTIFREARTELEETGSSTLYLALGFVKWFEDLSPRGIEAGPARFAPILLYPIELERRTSGIRFVMKLRNEEIRVNETLLEKLKLDFKLQFPELQQLPAGDAGVDVARVLNTLRKAFARVPGFEVVNESHLGFFSFSKFLLWRDLAEHSGEFTKNALVKKLLGEVSDAGAPPAFPDANELDTFAPASKSNLVVDADSSQHTAVAACLQKRSFVLQGPPGTGKSQTITNMIAECLAAGRRVLFVAEKRAALDVVARRLRSAGLGDFCLELHSNKTNKRDVVEQFITVLDKADFAMNPSALGSPQAADRTGAILNIYAKRVHNKTPLGLSHYECAERCVALESAPQVELNLTNILETTAETHASRIAAIHHYAAAARDAGDIINHPLTGLGISEWTPLQAKHWQTGLDTTLRAASELEATLESARRLLQFDNAIPLAAAQPAANLLQLIAGGVPDGSLAFATRADFDAALLRFQDCIEKARRRDAAHAEVIKNFDERIFKLPLDGILQSYRTNINSFFLIRWLALRSPKSQLQSVAKNTLPAAGELIGILGNAILARDLAAALDAEQPFLLQSLGAGARGAATDWSAAARMIQYARDFRENCNKLRSFTSEAANLPARRFEPADFVNVAKTLASAMDQFKTAFDNICKEMSVATNCFESGTQLSLKSIKKVLERWLSHSAEWRPWAQFVASEAPIVKFNLSPLCAALRSGSLTSEQLVLAYERAFFEDWLAHSIEQFPELRAFDGRAHERTIREFREHDIKTIRGAGSRIVTLLSEKLPRADTTVSNESEVGILRREAVKKTQHMPVRKLLEKIPALAPRLKPCFLMSPLSIAQYLPPSREPFDIVIFDEASQIPTHDAIGAIGRGTNVIIVGDSKQLPPTTFFEREYHPGDDETPGDDMPAQEVDSILEECIASNIPAISLAWHYRSRDERLITFSNAHYYENRLQTFPAPGANAASAGVSLVNVNGAFDRSKSRTNKSEAHAIADWVAAALADPARRTKSIGIVTFNQPQQTLIEDLLDERRATNPEMDIYFSDRAPEPVFIKNLENVQGDERDMILFSTTYGPDSGGRVSMNFGPLNRQGGERRLNVAITRAREQLVVFTSLAPEHIDLSKTNATGVVHLKSFLRYAAHGPKALGIGGRAARETVASAGAAEATIATDLQKRIITIGRRADINVGWSGYRVDLGVRDLKNPDYYILGIEFDGPNYKTGKTARERDRLRQSVLENLGWNMMKVWTPDYLHDREREIRRIMAALERCDAAGTLASAPGANATLLAPAPVEPGSEAKPNLQAGNTTIRSAARSERPQRAHEEYKFHSPVIVGSSDAFAHNINHSRIQQLIEQFVAAEGPVHADRAIRFVADCYQITRVTRAVSSRIEEWITSLAVARRIQQSGNYLWPATLDISQYRGFRVPSSGSEPRAIDEICPEELANAAELILKSAVGITQDALVRDTADLFGIRRVTERVRIAVNSGIDILQKSNRAVAAGEIIRLTSP
ncbi:MAG: DUF3320 domain-containing protein [Planctomycetota bacterium]